MKNWTNSQEYGSVIRPHSWDRFLEFLTLLAQLCVCEMCLWLDFGVSLFVICMY